MGKRILINAIVGTMIQMTFFILTLYLSKTTLDFFSTNKYHHISHFHIQLSSSIFAIMLIVQNLLTALINRAWFNWFSIFVVLTIYTIGWGEDFNSWPLKTIIFIGLGIITVIGKLFIDQKIHQMKNGR